MSVFEQKNSDALVVAGGNGSVLEVRVQVGGGQIKQFMSVFEQKNSDALVVAGGNGSVLEVRVQFLSTIQTQGLVTPPTLKKLKGHTANFEKVEGAFCFGLVRPSLCPFVCPLQKFSYSRFVIKN